MGAGEPDLEVGGVRNAVVARRMQDLGRLVLRVGGRVGEQRQENESDQRIHGGNRGHLDRDLFGECDVASVRLS